MNRETFIRITGLGGLGVLQSCQALDNLDTSAAAQGTGIQFTGLIKVLAKYPASASQKRAAQVQAGRAHVEIALKPAYEKRKSSISATQQSKLRNVEKDYRKNLSAAKKMPAVQAPSAIARVEAQRADLTKEISADAKERMLGLNAAWAKETSRISAGTYVPKVELPRPEAETTSAMREAAQALMAETQNLKTAQLLAVSVPKKGVPEEASAADSIMVYNTRTSQLQDNLVYVLGAKPKVGRETKFEGGFSATYVG